MIRIVDDTLRRTVRANRFVVAKIIAIRVNELQHGDRPRVPIPPSHSCEDIALAELANGALNYVIKLWYPNGDCTQFNLRDAWIDLRELQQH